MNLERYGPRALIVGGSEGIGAEAARQLAGAGFGVVLVARSPEPLDDLAAELRDSGASVRTLSVDLARVDALDQVRTATDDLDIGLLFYNAGANSVRGAFVDLDATATRAMLMVNVWNQAEFVRHYGQAMAARGRGAIVTSGSLSSFVGSPGLATYTAAKAYGRVFGEALWAELQPLGVDVLHAVVNFTATPAMARLGIDTARAMTSDEVATQVLANIAHGPLLIIGGEQAEAMAAERSRLSDRAEIVRRFAAPSREALGKN